MMYYLGAMQFIIKKIAIVMQVLMGTTAGESLNAAGNIFIGQVIYAGYVLLMWFVKKSTIGEQLLFVKPNM